MNFKKSLIAMALATATVATAVPATSFARGHDHGWHRGDRHYDHGRYSDRRGYRGDYRCRKSGGTTGLLLGGVAGALLGRAVDTRGDRTTGTVVGAGAGALAGRAIDRNSSC